MFSRELCVVICFRLEFHRRDGLYQVAGNASLIGSESQMKSRITVN